MKKFKNLNNIGFNTLGGMLAVIIWSTLIPLNRSLVEKIGVFTTASYVYLLSGVGESSYINVSEFLFCARI